VPDSSERLLARTRRRLALFTLLLVAALLVVVSLTTILIGLQILDSNVNQAVETAARSAVAQLDGSIPTATGDGEGDTNEHAPASSDTIVLVLGPDGQLVANTSRIKAAGLPDGAAARAAAASGQDLRTVTAGGLPVRLFTLPVISHEAPAGSAPVGYVQAGFVLTLHDRQEQELIAAILLAALVGLVGAGLVTVVVTGRALVPIRAAFAHERRFVAGASHELRTPAALIRASAEVLERERLVSEEGRPFVQDIVGESDRLARLVGDLLTLSASEAGGITVERESVDLAEVAGDATRRAAPLAAENGLTLTLREGPAGPSPALPVLGDRQRLIQLLMILLDNAFRHSPAGGTVTVAVARVGARAEVTVSDEGPGVPKEARERIFEPFARLPASRAGEQGSGLGLAIARAIAERHDGTVRVDDAPGGGARFVFGMPIR